MTGKWSGGRTETFLDVNSLPVTKKNVKRVAEQEKYESRLEKIKIVSPLHQSFASDLMFVVQARIS